MSANGDDSTLADVTNKVNGLVVKEEAKQRVKDAHWAEPQKFDYDTYNAKPKDQRPAVPIEGAEDEDVPTWAANATKYEWAEAYGDVGPEHKDLERMLFGSEHQMKEGDQFSKYV
jgi:ATP-dependent RNA helicase DDX3X